MTRLGLALKRRKDTKGRNAGKYAALWTVAALLVGAGGSQFLQHMADPVSGGFIGGLVAIGAGAALYLVGTMLQFVD